MSGNVLSICLKPSGWLTRTAAVALGGCPEPWRVAEKGGGILRGAQVCLSVPAVRLVRPSEGTSHKRNVPLWCGW